jgi:hypothetical protein
VSPADVEQPQVQDSTPKFEDVITAAGPNLSDAESRELEDFVTEYGVIFAMKSDDYRWADRVYHHIDTGEAQQIHQPPRRLPLAKQAEVGEMLNNMQQQGGIEEAYSPWSSPVLIWKKNGNLHLYVDYRKMNVTKKTVFHCPRLKTLWTRWLKLNDSPLWT